jgi:hypothetical protein
MDHARAGDEQMNRAERNEGFRLSRELYDDTPREIKRLHSERVHRIVQALRDRPGAGNLFDIMQEAEKVTISSYYNMVAPVDGGKRRRHKTKKSKRKNRKTRRRKH